MEGGAIRRHRWSSRSVPVIGMICLPMTRGILKQEGRCVGHTHRPFLFPDDGGLATGTVVTGGLGIRVPPGRLAGVRAFAANVTPRGGRDRITPVRPRGPWRRLPHHLLRRRHARQPDHRHHQQNHRACHGTTPVPEGRTIQKEATSGDYNHLLATMTKYFCVE